MTAIDNKETFISDYEIGFTVSFFAEKKYSRIPNLQGNPFFEYDDPIWFKKAGNDTESEGIQHKNFYLKEDFRETIREGYPLNNFPHCYLFHDLTDHSILSLQDIVDIEDIWVEVGLRVQNIQDVS